MTQLYLQLDIDEVALVDEGASGDGENRPSIRRIKKRNTKKEPSPMIVIDFSKFKAADREKAQGHFRTVLKEMGEGVEREKMSTLDALLEMLPTDDARNALLAMIEQLKAPPAAPAEPAAPATPVQAAAPAAPAKTEEEDESMLKRLEKKLDAVVADNKAILKRNGELEGEVAVLKQDKAVAKKRHELEEMKVPGELDELVPAVLEIEKKCDEKTTEAVVGVLKQLAALTGLPDLVRPRGKRPADPTLKGGGASEKLKSLVKKKREAKPDLTEDAAKLEVFEENEGLYAEVSAELGG